MRKEISNKLAKRKRERKKERKREIEGGQMD